jgi:hypothetical protein
MKHKRRGRALHRRYGRAHLGSCAFHHEHGHAHAAGERPVGFDAALDRFVASAQGVINEHFAQHYPRSTVPVLKLDHGARYVRVYKDDGTSRSVYVFVDTRNGDILKSASWKTPAKHARGNIFSDDPLSAVTSTGGRYIWRG